MILLSLGKRKQSYGARAAMFQYGDILHSQKLLDAQKTQSFYFADMPKSLVMIFQTVQYHVQLTCDYMEIDKKKNLNKNFKRVAVPRNLWQVVGAAHDWKTRITGAKEKLYLTWVVPLKL